MKKSNKSDKLRKIVNRLTKAYKLKISYAYRIGRGSYGYQQNNKLYHKAYQELKELIEN